MFISLTCCPEVIDAIAEQWRNQFLFDSVFFQQADLIHMGAKYSPCMRDDENVKLAIQQQIATESQSACCVLNDGSGCVQTTEDKCSVGCDSRFA